MAICGVRGASAKMRLPDRMAAMIQRWLDTETDAEAEERSAAWQSVTREQIDAGNFWADRIKQHRDDPCKRLRIAIDNLPLPGAFREAAIALRAIMRAKRKSKQSHEKELGSLYWLAAVESFMLPYADSLKEPGFNVMVSVPGRKIRDLSTNYQELGYERLGILNKSDVKWLVEAWGEPKSHQTLNEVRQDLWNEYETKILHAREAAREKTKREIQQLLRR
jgi:hypothetical protein